MILMHTMEIGYTSFETALLRTMHMLDEIPPGGSDWHAQLLARAATPIEGLRPAILLPDVAKAAGAVKNFRHWATRGYDVEFVAADAANAVAAARSLIALAGPALERLADALDR